MKQKQPIKMQKSTRERSSSNVWRFLDSHPGIVINRLAADVDYDPSNFRKYMNDKKTLPHELLVKVEKYLKHYGLNVY